eukprot:561816-Prymnesium_polylepis.1
MCGCGGAEGAAVAAGVVEAHDHERTAEVRACSSLPGPHRRYPRAPSPMARSGCGSPPPRWSLTSRRARDPLQYRGCPAGPAPRT